MLFEEREVTSIPGLLDALRDATPSGKMLWYRGHGKATLEAAAIDRPVARANG